MIGYKATTNMVCKGFTYEVGKTYTLENTKLEMCSNGYHFCRNMTDVRNYYSPDKEGFILLEVEAHGTVINDSDKSVTDEIRIIRVIPPEEYNFSYSSFTYNDKGVKMSRTIHNLDGSKKLIEYGDGYPKETFIPKPSTTTTVTIDGESYTLNLVEAFKARVLEKVIKDIIPSVGEVYEFSSGNRAIVTKVMYDGGKAYQLLGAFGGLNAYSDAFYKELHTLKEVGEHLTKNKAKFITNFKLDLKRLS